MTVANEATYGFDLRFRPWCKLNLNSSGVLRYVDWKLVTDVSEQPIGPIFMGQAVKEESNGFP